VHPPLAAILVVVLVVAGCQSALGTPGEPSDRRVLDALNQRGVPWGLRFRFPRRGPWAVCLTGYTAYRECARVGRERENLPRSARWLGYTPIGEQLAPLDRTDVYWRGTGTVDGTEAAVLTVPRRKTTSCRSGILSAPPTPASRTRRWRTRP
jgi:hypothetical protein